MLVFPVTLACQSSIFYEGNKSQKQQQKKNKKTNQINKQKSPIVCEG